MKTKGGQPVGCSFPLPESLLHYIFFMGVSLAGGMMPFIAQGIRRPGHIHPRHGRRLRASMLAGVCMPRTLRKAFAAVDVGDCLMGEGEGRGHGFDYVVLGFEVTDGLGVDVRLDAADCAEDAVICLDGVVWRSGRRCARRRTGPSGCRRRSRVWGRSCTCLRAWP